MTPRILLLGKNGQIGSDLTRLLPRAYDVVALSRHDLDLTRPDDIRRTVQQSRPMVILNAAAYTAVDRAEKEELLAQAINAEAPGILAEEAKKVGAFLVHYSTDYVFDGTKRTPYTEQDTPNPLGAYGRTKLAGEDAIRAVAAPHLIFRTAWVYATAGKNFLLTILRLAAERDQLRIVNDQFGAPTWSHEIAAATVRVIKNAADSSDSDLNVALAAHAGTYHMTAAGKSTWHDFAVAILDECSRLSPQTPWFAAATDGRPLIAKHIVPITTSEYPTPALRPSYSILSNERFARAFGFSLRDWRNQLAAAVRSH